MLADLLRLRAGAPSVLSPPMTRALAFATVAAALLFAAPVAFGDAAPPSESKGGPPWKNTQILPKDMPKDQLKTIMKGMAKAIGQDCDFCHDMPNADKDTDHKKAAREMMRMTAEINSKFLASSKSQVMCGTCHRGKEKPEVLGKK